MVCFRCAEWTGADAFQEEIKTTNTLAHEMVDDVKSWVKENQALVFFLIAQTVALTSGLAYIVNWKADLESRVHILEVRGSPHLAEINNRLTVTEKETQANSDRFATERARIDARVDRIVEVLTRELGKSPQQLLQPNR